MRTMPFDYADTLTEQYDRLHTIKRLAAQYQDPSMHAYLDEGLEKTVHQMKVTRNALSGAQKYLPEGTFEEQITGLEERIEAYENHDENV